MALDVQALAQMMGIIGDLDDGGAARQLLREAFPGFQFPLCSEDDIVDELEPVGETPAFRLYFLDGQGHCLRLTSDAVSATGVVLAAKEQ
jgi:hypothetical protein